MSQAGKISGYLPEASGITVNEALRLGVLTRARVVAGREGLNNVIRYVSVIEVPDAVRWFQGYELMITAAYSYRSVESLVQLIEDLVCSDAAALAMCYCDRYLGGIPEPVIRRAEQLRFPVLEIPLDVRYVEIITAVMTAIVNRRTQFLELALNARLELENLFLRGEKLDKMAQRLSDLLTVPVILLTPSCQVRFVALPSGQSVEQTILKSDWRSVLDGTQPDAECDRIMVGEVNGLFFSCVQLRTATTALGTLVALEVDPQESRRLLLSQCSMPLAVELLLERARQEAEWHLQKGFLDDVLNETMPAEIIEKRAKAYGIDLVDCSCVIVAGLDYSARKPGKTQEGEVKALRDGLRKLADRLMYSEADGGLVFTRGDIVVILPKFKGLAADKVIPLAKRLAKALCEEAERRLTPATVSVGIGSLCPKVGDLSKGFRSAQNAIEIGRCLPNNSPIHCWDDLGIYKLLFAVKGSGEAHAFVSHSIGALLDRGNPRTKELLATLEVLLACKGNLEMAASRLHLHRNTVRYRLQQIKSLLGYDPLHRSFETELALALRNLT